MGVFRRTTPVLTTHACPAMSEISWKRLIAIMLASPLMVALAVVLVSALLPVLFFPAASSPFALALLGSGLYGWVAGKLGGPGSGIAVLIGLSVSWGVLTPLSLGPVRGSPGATALVAAVLASIAVAVSAAEVSGRRRARRRFEKRGEDGAPK